MYTKQEIEMQLESFRFAVGKHVHIHSSLKAVGEIEGRGETLLSCLIDFFTQNGGMVSFPTHTWNKNVLDLNRKETCTGKLSELALQREDGIRTMNPTHSMVIFGEHAAEYAKLDEDVHSSTSPNGCYGKMDGYILLLGVGQEKNTYIHAVEERLQIPNRVTEECYNTTILKANGESVVKPLRLVYEETGDISTYFGKLEPAFCYYACIVDGKIGNAAVQCCSAKKISKVLEILHNRCGDRELFADDMPLQKEWYYSDKNL